MTMADTTPTSVTTFQQLLTLVAEKLGVADYRTDRVAIPPVTDGYNLDLCRRRVNQAIQTFIDDAPDEGWRWRRRLYSITLSTAGTGDQNISSDPSRYLLPDNFGGITDRVSFAADTDNANPIIVVDESYIRELKTTDTQTGKTKYVAFLPYEPTTSAGSARRRWEMLVHPAPSTADVIVLKYELQFNSLVAEGGTLTSAVADTSRTEPNDYFNGWTMTILDGTGRGSYGTVTDFANTGGVFTVAAWTGALGGTGVTPAANSKYILEPAHPNLHPAGARFDSVIKTACQMVCEIEDADQTADTHHTEYYHKVRLPKAIQEDRRMTPKFINPKQSTPERTWNAVTYTGI